MKRFACIFLCLCFITGILPGMSFAVSAEDAVKLQEATIDFTMPQSGEQLPDSFAVNEGFAVSMFTWEIYRAGTWHPVSDPGKVYADNQTYRLSVQLVCQDGYCVDYASFQSGYMPGKINGEAAQATFFGDKDENNVTVWKGVTLETVIFGSAVPVVPAIDILGIPVQSGESATTQQISLNTEHVSILDCEINVDGEKVDAFQLNYGWYNIHVNLAVSDGYVLNPDVITINGQSAELSGWEIDCGFEVNEGWISLSCKREPEGGYVDGVKVSGLPSAIFENAQITAPQLQVKWSSNGAVTVEKVQWVDADHVPVTGNFILGNIYFLEITLQTSGETPFRDFFNLELLDETESNAASALATAANSTMAVAYIRYALLPAVDSVEIRLDQPTVGAVPTAPTVSSDALYTIESYEWTDMADLSQVTAFEAGHRYQLKLQILPENGYQLREGAQILINGEAVQTVTNPDGQTVTMEYSFVKQVDRVEISVDMPADKTVPGTPTLPADALAEVLNHQWLDAVTGETVTQFAVGSAYQFILELQAAEGYGFTSQTEFLLNGKSVKAILVDNIASLLVAFDLQAPRHEVHLQGIPNAIGPEEPVQIPLLGCDDSHVTIFDVQWMDEDKEPLTGVFEAGNVYFLAVTLKTDALAPFSDALKIYAQDDLVAEVVCEDALTAVAYIRYSLLTKVELSEITLPVPQLGDEPAAPMAGEDARFVILSYKWKDLCINGIFAAFAEGHHYALSVEICPVEGMEFGDLTVLVNGQEVELKEQNGEYASFELMYSFRTVIDRIDLFAPELVVGKEVDPAQIVVLTEGVSLQSGSWINSVNFEALSGTVMKAPYTLRASVAAMEGFEFADNAQIYLNGALVSDFTVSTEAASCSVSFDLRDMITDIQISGMPQISIGGSTQSITMTLPEGVPYSVQANWLLYGGDYQFAGPGSTFEDGKVYYLEILVKPAEGYRIADDAIISVDGAEFTGIAMTGDIGIWLYKQYNCGLQVIDRVDLTVTAPVDGQLPSAVQLPEGVCVSLRDFVWSYSETGEFSDAVDLLDGDVFEPGFHYMISGALVADKGYVFAENLVITVNGVPSNIDLGDQGVINLGDTAFAGHSFGLLQQEQVPDPTGDCIGIVIALLAASAAAWFALKKKR